MSIDGIRSRVASATATQEDCFELLKLVDTLKYSLFLRDVQDSERGKNCSLLPVYRFTIVATWMDRLNRAKRLWVKRTRLRAQMDAIYYAEKPEQRSAESWDKEQQAAYRAVSVQFDATQVRLARICQRLSNNEVADVCDYRDAACPAEIGA